MNNDIAGVIIRELMRREDQRGWLMELFRRDEIPKDALPVMSYISMTNPGVTRGPHEHVHQTDLFCFIGPSMFRLYLWDNRPQSVSFRTKCTIEVGRERPTMVIVPPGVVHAYKNIGNVEGIVFNAPNQLYAGVDRKEPVDEIRHEDKPNSPFRIID